MLFEEAIRDVIREALATARARSQELRAQAEGAARIESVWRDLHNFLSREWPLHVLHLLDKEAPLLRQLRTDNHPIVPTLESAYRVAKSQADEVVRRFPAHFEEGCRNAGLNLDRESRHPRYSFSNKFLQLDVDDGRRTARLNDNEGKLAELPADVPAIVELVKREAARLFDRPFDGRKFIKLIRANYLHLIKRDKHADGTSVPIRQITRRLGKNLKTFRTDEFAVDLARLIDQGPLEVEGFRIDLQQTKDTSQGMLLPGLAGRGYIGFVVFKKV